MTVVTAGRHLMESRNISVYPSRREYNRWVSNQTLEDFALRFTALKSRRWSCYEVARTTLGSISFLALEAIGAILTIQYGFYNALASIVAVSILIFVLSLPIAIRAAVAGVDIDLLTRGAGFGYLGSTVTSLIYAGFTFIFFALEAVIIATALELCFGLPLSYGYLLSSCAVLPVVIYGITSITKMHRITQTPWLVLQIVPFVIVLWPGNTIVSEWRVFNGLSDLAKAHNGGEFNIVLFGTGSAVVFSLVAQIGEQVDFLRFLPKRCISNRFQWWAALILSGPGWIIVGALKMIGGSLLAVLALKSGLLSQLAIDPVHIYLNVWQSVLSPEIALAITGLFVVICQYKINITNAYAGSIAWSNFFSRLTHSHPGRVVWLLFNVVIAWLLMELGVYGSLEKILSIFSIIAVAWIGTIAVDLAFNKTVGLSPKKIEFKRGHLYDVNPVGVGSMCFAIVVGFTAYSGVFGETVKALACYLVLGSTVIMTPALAWWSRGRYYLVRPDNVETETNTAQCIVCQHDYDMPDLASCPAYHGNICSLCCSLDTRCADKCRSDALLIPRLLTRLRNELPGRYHSVVDSSITKYVFLLSVVASFLIAIFALVYFQTVYEHGQLVPVGLPEDRFQQRLFRSYSLLFFFLLMLAAIVMWAYVLNGESASRARRETATQNERLALEVKSHRQTEQELNRAKNVAEAANEAKSRYLVGLSHELRTPLNSIFGYAQLMDSDSTIPAHRKNGVRVIKESTSHLGRLIESLLDISKIEAGRVTLNREKIHLSDFMTRLCSMFSLQAEKRGLKFTVDVGRHLPEYVYTDESRLRQILINLLTNAFKFTDEGEVCFSLRYKNQVAIFRINDTGIGIEADKLDIIFNPFETITTNRSVKGTGLGLTISRLLTEVMGGDLSVKSTPGAGSEFIVRIMLSSATDGNSIPQERINYQSIRVENLSIAVVDDDVDHCLLLKQFLTPFGFEVQTFSQAEQLMSELSVQNFNACILDISMPGLSGWQLAKHISDQPGKTPVILIVSALTDNERTEHLHDSHISGVLAKPLDFSRLMEHLVIGLDITPSHSVLTENNHTPVKDLDTPLEISLPGASALIELNSLNRIGHIRGMLDLLDEIQRLQPESIQFLTQLRTDLNTCQLSAFEKRLHSAMNRSGVAVD